MARFLRPALLTSESADVRRASGTAVAVANLVEAFAANGVPLAVIRPRRQPLGHTAGRAWFNQALPRAPAMYDAFLGVGGDGHAAAARHGIPFVALPKALYAAVMEHERGLTRALLRWHAGFEARGARAAALVIVPSRFAADVVHQQMGVPRSRIEVIPEPFPAARWRRELSAPQRSGRRVLVVAHLYPRKRVRDVLAAWPEVRRARPGAQLDIAGAGPELAALRRAAAAVEGVRALGHVPPPQLLDLYARADVAVSASAHETFGYAVLEALASGLPVVAAAAPAVVELCTGSVAAVVEVGDVRALTAAIIAALDPSTASAAARVNPAVAARYDLAPIGAAYLDALATIRK